MKKMILTMVAMMTLASGFAKTSHHRVTTTSEAYDMTVDMRRLAAKLDLTDYQMEAVQVIHSQFTDAMLSAALSPRFERRAKVHQAVGKDVHQMKRVLDDKQFRTYMLLLGTTLHNRGI